MSYYTDDRVTIHHGTALDVIRQLPDESVDAVVTDPPYGLSNTDPAHVVEALTKWLAGDREFVPRVRGGGFMGAAWDEFVPPPAAWDECRRVLKPGGHLIVFAGPRTQDLMGLSIRLAEFDIRDGIAWLFGSGFPKSLDVSKAIDKAAGAEREVLGPNPYAARRTAGDFWLVNDDGWQPSPQSLTAPATPDAERWQGWGTALKPAFEPVVVARKPLTGTVAANVLQWGTGALNVDACRVAHDGSGVWGNSQNPDAHASALGYMGGEVGRVSSRHDAGRWPTNVVLDDSQAAELDRATRGMVGSNSGTPAKADGSKSGVGDVFPMGARTDDGSTYDQRGDFGASRFFPTFRYEAKAPATERPRVNGTAHPTVKPLDLMRWLVRLVTPPGGTVLEPFAGSGTTVEACIVEGFHCIAIEREADYLPLIMQRVNRRRDPVAYIKAAGDELGLFELEELA